MIEVRGLGDSIFEAMLASAQNKIVNQIMNAAGNGQTSVIVNGKGLTKPFLAALESEGIEILERNDDLIELFWEW